MTAYLSLEVLRREAETSLAQKQPLSPTSDLSATAMVHELQVYQIELELQHESLKDSYATVEAALTKYQDLFDMTPVGCFCVSMTGEILEINRKGTALLGLRGTEAIGSQIRTFFGQQSLPVLELFFTTIRQSGTEVTISEPLVLRGKKLADIYVNGTARATVDFATGTRFIRLAFCDVTAEVIARQDAVRALAQLSPPVERK